MNIGRTCQDEGIAVEHFRRIIFFEDKVRPTSRGGTDVPVADRA
jgi:hypothetical protein